MNKNYFINCKNNLKYILFISLFYGVKSNIQSKDNDTTVVGKSFKEVKITASKLEQSELNVPKNVIIINEQEIKELGLTSLSSILAQQANISIIGNYQTPGSLQNIYLRGANSEHTQIIIDGVRITDPSNINNAINLSEISVANIKKIEIIKGTQSTLYGSSAIGGVIKITTKSGGKRGLNINADILAGTFGKDLYEFSQQIHVNKTFGNGFYINAEAFNTNVKGFDATVDTVTIDSNKKSRDMDDFRKLDLFAKVGYKNKDWNIFLSGKRVDQKLDIDDREYSDDPNYTVGFKRNLINYHLARKIDKFEFKFLGGYTNSVRKNLDEQSDDGAYFKGDYFSEVINNEFNASYTSDNFKLVLGNAYYTETMNSETVSIFGTFPPRKNNLDSLNLNTTNIRYFAHLQINGGILKDYLSSLNLDLGVAFNNHSTYGNYATFEVSPSYKITNNLMAYASFATGYNSPSLYKLYSPNRNSSGVTRGNKNLTQEKSTSKEIGVKYKDEKLSFKLSFYETQISDLIEYVYLWNNSVDIDSLSFGDARGDTYLNMAEQVNRGIDININYRITKELEINLGGGLLEGKTIYNQKNNPFFNNYYVQSYSNGQFINTPNNIRDNKEIDTKILPRRSHTANLKISYKVLENLKLIATVNHVGRRNDVFYNSRLGPYGALGTKPVSDFTLLNFAASYTPIEDLIITLRVNNILNSNYSEILGYNTIGRAIYLKLNYNINISKK